MNGTPACAEAVQTRSVFPTLHLLPARASWRPQLQSVGELLPSRGRCELPKAQKGSIGFQAITNFWLAIPVPARGQHPLTGCGAERNPTD